MNYTGKCVYFYKRLNQSPTFVPSFELQFKCRGVTDKPRKGKKSSSSIFIKKFSTLSSAQCRLCHYLCHYLSITTMTLFEMLALLRMANIDHLRLQLDVVLITFRCTKRAVWSTDSRINLNGEGGGGGGGTFSLETGTKNEQISKGLSLLRSSILRAKFWHLNSGRSVYLRSLTERERARETHAYRPIVAEYFPQWEKKLE